MTLFITLQIGKPPDVGLRYFRIRKTQYKKLTNIVCYGQSMQIILTIGENFKIVKKH